MVLLALAGALCVPEQQFTRGCCANPRCWASTLSHYEDAHVGGSWRRDKLKKKHLHGWRPLATSLLLFCFASTPY
jgi:hypothetical protein